METCELRCSDTGSWQSGATSRRRTTSPGSSTEVNHSLAHVEVISALTQSRCHTDKKRLRLPLLDAVAPTPSPATKQLDRLALAYWTRSAAQDNVDALVKMGDYFYAGLGTEDGLPQLEKAAGCYQSAATTKFSAMAMWALGWMHETGKGVPQVR